MRRSRSKPTATLLLTALAASVSLLHPVQPALALPAAFRQPADDVLEPELSRRAAWDLSRTAVLDLQSSGAPLPRDLRIAALLFETAHALAPDDDHILRMLIDAWSEVGEQEKVIAYTRELLNLKVKQFGGGEDVLLNGSDTVALLRLVSGGISSRQNVDARLEAYEKFLGPAGEKLDPSIRSRLALDAALLLRERGDTEGFVAKLAAATSLDSTNKDAASLAATLYSLEEDDPVGRLQLLVNLLKADIFDPETHLAIGRELAAGGAYAQAKRFYQTYQTLLSYRGQRLPAAQQAEYQVVEWHNDSAEKLVATARLQIETQRTEIANKRRQLLLQEAPASEIPDPEDYRLPLESERVRAAAAASTGNEGQIDYAMQELETTYARQLALLADPKARTAAGHTDESAAQASRALTAELMWMRLWTGRRADEAAQLLAEVERDPDADKSAVERLRGWLLVRQGQLDEAEKALSASAPDNEFARLGLALLAEKRGAVDDAVQRYIEVYHSAPGTLAAAWAKTRAKALSGKIPDPPEFAGRLNDLAVAVPDWLEGMIRDPRRVVSIMASPVASHIHVLQPAMLKLSITNLAPIPLGLGPDRPIESGILLAPRLAVGFQSVPVGNASTVIRVDRRLRLLPQEKLELVVWADVGILGYIMDQVSISPAEVRWQVLPGFTIDENGIYRAGPTTVSCQSGIVTRAASSKAGMDPVGLIRFIDSGSIDDILESLLVIKNQAQQRAALDNPAFKEALEAVARALAKRFPSLDRTAKVALLAKLPTTLIAPWLAPLESVVRADADPLVQTAVLLTRVLDPNDPAFASASNSGDDRLVQLAALMRVRLEEGSETYSTLGRPAPDAGAKRPEQPPPPPAPTSPDTLPGISPDPKK